MKNLKITLVLILAGILFFSGCTQQTQDLTANPPTGNAVSGAQSNTVTTGKNLAVGTFKVIRTDAGYAPSPITIKKGSTMIFENRSSGPDWPASAKHPTHTVYPGSGIEKCRTEQEKKIFDACRELAPGESYSFTFNEVGEWAYHDHVNVKKFGKIIVVE